MGNWSQHNSHLKSYHGLWLLSPNRYELDLLNEALYILIGQEAAQISEVKVGGKSARSADPWCISVESCRVGISF